MSNIFKQTNVGKWWGAFRNLGSYVTFYLGIINFIVLLINTYILGFIAQAGLPIPIWLVIILALLVFFIFLVIAMVLEHKYTIPSFMTYWNQQWWLHGNPMVNELKGMQEQLDRIEKELKKNK